MLRIGRAVLRERRAPAPPAAARRCTAASRRSSWISDLAGRHAIAEVGEDPADLAVGLRRDRDLIDGRERADHVDRALHRIVADFLDLNRLRRRLLGACLCRFGARAGPATRGESKEDKETNEKRHRVWARAARARERAYEGQDGKSICGTSQPDRSGDYRSPASTTGSADAFQPPPSALIRRTLEDSRRARSVTDVRWLLSAAF